MFNNSRKEHSQNPSAEQINPKDYKSIGIMQFGESPFLIRQDKSGFIVFERIDLSKQREYFQSESRRLSRDSIIKFDGVEANDVTIVNIGLVPPKIRWVQRSSGLEEPVIIYPTTNAVTQEQVDIELSTNEIKDLFGEEARGKQDVAAFFTIPTATEEIVSIVLRRDSPVILNIIPSNDGINMNSISGLHQFFNNVYSVLNKKLTPFQQNIQSRIDAALDLKEKGPLDFKFKDNTSAMRTQQEIQTLIYRTQILLASMEATVKGQFENPTLLTLAPFVNDFEIKVQEKISNGAGRLSGIVNKYLNLEDVVPTTNGTSFIRRNGHVVQIDNSIWTRLLAKPDTGFLLSSNKSKPVGRITAKPEVVIPKPVVTPKPAEKIRPEVKVEPRKVEPVKPAPAPRIEMPVRRVTPTNPPAESKPATKLRPWENPIKSDRSKTDNYSQKPWEQTPASQAPKIEPPPQEKKPWELETDAPNQKTESKPWLVTPPLSDDKSSNDGNQKPWEVTESKPSATPAPTKKPWEIAGPKDEGQNTEDLDNKRPWEKETKKDPKKPWE